MTARDEIHDAFMAHFPIAGGNASLEYVETVELGAAFGITVRLIVWDTRADGAQTIRDVKEQRLHFAYAVEPARLDAFLKAFAKVMARVLAAADVEMLMPHDIASFTALKLAKAHTEADFERALLVKSRLGRYLAPTG